MRTSSVETEQLKAIIQDKMHNCYIQNYAQLPTISDDKLFILSSVLNNTDLSENKKVDYIVATMLVQLALDTHDLVAETDEHEARNVSEKEKQLTVLAGDFYSGLYYLLLSETEDIEMIQVLAVAIREINEYKMSLYSGNLNSFNMFMTGLKRIESHLFVRVAAYAGETTVRGIIPEWLLTRRIQEELNVSDGQKRYTLYNVWNLHAAYKGQHTALRNSIASILKEDTELIKSRLHYFPEHLQSVKLTIHNTLGEIPANNRSFAEEG